MVVKKTAAERMRLRIEEALASVNLDPSVSKRILKYIYPPVATGLHKPLRPQFRAAVLQRRTPGFVRRPDYYYFFELSEVVIDPDLEYRLIEIEMVGESDPDWALLITPKGKDTQVIKNQIFHYGWDELLKSNPDFEVRLMNDLVKAERIQEPSPTVPRIFYSRRKADGRYREGCIIYPRGWPHAQG